MSVGFELCFGYNWEKMNNTIAEPLTNTNLIRLIIRLSSLVLVLVTETLI